MTLLELRRVGADGSGTFVGFLGGDEGARDDRLRLIALDFTGESSGRPAAWRVDMAAEGVIPKARKNTYKDNPHKFVDLVRQALAAPRGNDADAKFRVEIQRGDAGALRLNVTERLAGAGGAVNAPVLRETALPPVPAGGEAQAAVQLADAAARCIGSLHHQIRELRAENERLKRLSKEQQELLDSKCDAKEQLETSLYENFVKVLNTKKDRIRELQQELADANARPSARQYDGDSDQSHEDNPYGARVDSDDDGGAKPQASARVRVKPEPPEDVFTVYTQAYIKKEPGVQTQIMHGAHLGDALAASSEDEDGAPAAPQTRAPRPPRAKKPRVSESSSHGASAAAPGVFASAAPAAAAPCAAPAPPPAPPQSDDDSSDDDMFKHIK